MSQNEVIVTIKWCVQDFKDALVEAGEDATDEQVQVLIDNATRDLEDRSIERGWEVLEYHAAQIKNNEAK